MMVPEVVALEVMVSRISDGCRRFRPAQMGFRRVLEAVWKVGRCHLAVGHGT